MSAFALELIQEAVTAGGPAILHMPLLMRRLQVDLPESLLAPFRPDAPPPDTPGPRYLCDTLMRMTHVMLALYLILKRQFLLQVEVFIQVCLLFFATHTGGSLPRFVGAFTQNLQPESS